MSTPEPLPNTFEKACIRTWTRVANNPGRVGALFLAVCGASLWYEVKVRHNNRVPSPNLDNHLEYDMKDAPPPAARVKADTISAAAPVEPGERKQSTVMVTRGHIAMREGHWDIRNSERNWSIMAQDLQRQKDDFEYRVERSKDDDFGRHASSSTRY